jgi:hypothetical protein
VLADRGLTAATFIMLLLVPVLYAIFVKGLEAREAGEARKLTSVGGRASMIALRG